MAGAGILLAEIRLDHWSGASFQTSLSNVMPPRASPRPTQVRDAAMPVCRLLVRPRDAERRGLVEGLRVDHEANGQAVSREPARQDDGREREDVAHRRVAQIFEVRVAVAVDACVD